VGITAFAFDADETDSVTYSLDGDAQGRFAIDALSGVVTVAGAIDREHSPTYQIVIRASSTDGSYATRLYTITIGDMNDNAPVIDPGQTLVIAENSAIGTSLGVAAVTDPDVIGTSQDWLIVIDSSGGGFTIDPVTGVITTLRAFDHETIASYTLVLRVSDGDFGSIEQTVTIAILDVNELPIAVGENYTIRTDQILSVSSPGLLANDFDLDGDILQSVLVAGPARGVLTMNANGTFTYDPAPGFFGTDTFVYRVSDGGLTSNAVTVTIQVTAVNEVVVIDNPTPSNPAPAPATPTQPEQTPRDTSSEAATEDAQSDDAVQVISEATIEPDAPSLNALGFGFRQLRSGPTDASGELESSLRQLQPRMPLERTHGISLMRTGRGESLLMRNLLQADLDEAIVWNRWEQIQQGDEAYSLNGSVGVSTVGVSAGLVSVGYVMWALRGGMFLATVYSSLPAWRMLDPATLLTNQRLNKRSQGQDAVEDLLG
jgi:hypothetical protein